jgi:oxygen-independent coproporphyrinogen-3 oxidase
MPVTATRRSINLIVSDALLRRDPYPWDNLEVTAFLDRMPIGLYMSVPFCKTKCSYCNFASDVFSRGKMQAYIERMIAQMHSTGGVAKAFHARLEKSVDTIYLGGGTPSTLPPAQLESLFAAVYRQFSVDEQAEITVECAPGTISDEMLRTLLRCGVNRVSLGVQSFIDQEARSVGRLHTRAVVLADIARLRQAGITNINVDLIAGLPHQTATSWDESVEAAITLELPHVSVYMLEVDEDSRLGRELLAGGTRYHAHFVPDDDLTAQFYGFACEKLNAEGIQQYEISNFARPGMESRHNLKYWTRQPYLGLGVDAHSMLAASEVSLDAVRLATADNLETYMSSPVEEASITCTPVSEKEAWEETFFLGLRLNQGVDLGKVGRRFGRQQKEQAKRIITELLTLELVEIADEHVRLTPNGRLLSNEVFQRFLTPSNDLDDVLQPMPLASTKIQ